MKDDLSLQNSPNITSMTDESSVAYYQHQFLALL